MNLGAGRCFYAQRSRHHRSTDVDNVKETDQAIAGTKEVNSLGTPVRIQLVNVCAQCPYCEIREAPRIHSLAMHTRIVEPPRSEKDC